MNKKKVTKALLIAGLIFLPSFIMVSFLSITKNIKTLEVINENPVPEVSGFFMNDTVSSNLGDILKAKLNVVQPIGSMRPEVAPLLGNCYEQVYKNFEKNHLFQFVTIVNVEDKKDFMEVFNRVPNMAPENWVVFFTDCASISKLNQYFGSTIDGCIQDELFLVDTELLQRGRIEEDTKKPFKYDAKMVPFLKKQIRQDIQILITEYKRAFKKYDKYRE